MGRRTKPIQNITVVAPRSGTPAAPRALLKAVRNEAKKNNRLFHEQDPISANELQSLEDASNWNGLLLNARGERGPQWDVTSQMYHVNIGDEEYFNPTLLEENIEPIPEPPIKTEPESKPQSQAPPPVGPTSGQVDVQMANASPTQMYRNQPTQGMGMSGGDIPMNRGGSVSGPSGYPQYGQAINGMHGYGGPMNTGPIQHSPTHSQHPPQMMPPEMGGGGMQPQQMYGHRPPSMDMMRPPQPQHHGPPGSGIPYSNAGGPNPGHGHGHGMDPGSMSMGYGAPQQPGYGPGAPGGMPGGVQYPRGPPPPGSGPMGGSYGGMY